MKRRRGMTSFWFYGAHRSLPKAEAADLARRAGDGDADARWAFARSVAPLVHKLAAAAARKIGRSNLTRECADAGLVEVWRKAHLYDPARGAPGTFAAAAARNGFREVIADLAYPARMPVWAVEARGAGAKFARPETLGCVAVAKAAPDRIEPYRTWLDIEADSAEDPADAIDRAELLRKLCGLRSLLTIRERRALALRFRLGLDRPSIGRLMGVSYQRAQQIEARALAKLRDALGVRVA